MPHQAEPARPGLRNCGSKIWGNRGVDGSWVRVDTPVEPHQAGVHYRGERKSFYPLPSSFNYPAGESLAYRLRTSSRLVVHKVSLWNPYSTRLVDRNSVLVTLSGPGQDKTVVLDKPSRQQGGTGSYLLEVGWQISAFGVAQLCCLGGPAIHTTYVGHDVGSFRETR